MMARIAGIKYHKTAGGKLKSITIDLQKWGEYLEDFLDMLEVERIKKSADGKIKATQQQVKKLLERKHKVKL
jgi:hypothetical protein